MKSQVTITKQKIIDHLHNKVGFAKSVMEKIISDLFDEIVSILKKDDDNIQIPNFGVFSVHHKNERPGMNMHTKEKMMIDARKVIRFVPSRILKNRVNDAG